MDFIVVGIDESDGSATTLYEADNSGDCREWLRRYVAHEDAGGWDVVEVLDTRSECAERLWAWDRDEVE